MFARYRSLYAAVRASYSPGKAAEEKRSEYLAWVFYRPLSLVVTPLFLLAGISADGVTLLMFLAAAAMPVIGVWGGAQAYLGVVVIAVALQVLDCVDGNIARVTQRFSAVGSMLDGLCTLLFWALFFFAVGCLAQGTEASWVAQHGREIGLGLAALLLAQRELEDTFDHRFAERVRTAPPVPGRTDFDLGRVAKPIEQIAAFGGLGFAGARGLLPQFLAGLALYQAGVTTLWLPRYALAVWRRR